MEDTLFKIAIVAAPILLMLVMLGAASTRYTKPVGYDDDQPEPYHPPLGNYGPNNEGLPDISKGWHIFADGNTWCAVGPVFEDLQASPSGWGYTHAEAYRDLMRVLSGSDAGYLTHRPHIADFRIHIPTVKPNGQ